MSDSINGNSIHYVRQGDGSPVILIHGMAASLNDWNSLLPELSESGYAGYALDLLGHGDSPKPDDPSMYHVEILLDTLAAWIESLNLSQPPALIGHSLGGYLSLLYARRHPEAVRGLLLIDPLYSPRQLSPLIRIVRQRPMLGEKAMRIVPEWLIQFAMGWDPDTISRFSSGARQQIVSDYKRTSPHFVYITSDFDDLTQAAEAIHQPALILWGDKDLTLNPGSFPRLARHMPHAQQIAIHGCGHQPHIGKPDMVNKLTLNFLDDLKHRDTKKSHPFGDPTYGSPADLARQRI